MAEGDYRPKSNKRRNRRVCIGVLVLVVLIVILALVIGLSLRKTSEHDAFKQTFMSRCEAFGGSNCSQVWSAFEEAYVGKDACMVPPEAYNALLKAAPFTPACNRMLFWSKTKDVVHEFTEKRSCHVTLEDSLVGSVLDGLTWCGKEGSKETFTSGCPGWSDCDNNTVRSFWNKASEAFAQVACGDVSVMLNGSIVTPFSPASIFGSIEEKEVSNCTNASLKDLQKELAQGIAYSCQEVAESRIDECASNPTIACGACW